jgi:DNA-directed RNA polymerase specialized sigma24 family protein
MYVLDGYSHNEISQSLGTSIGTSKSNLARARMILKEKIEKEFKQDSISQPLE